MKVGEKLTISLQSLLDEQVGQLHYGTFIDVDNDNCIRLIGNYGVVCMDGETCVITSITDNYVELMNEDGEEDELFLLTHEELGIASFR